MAKPCKQILAISNSAALFVDAWETPYLARYLVGLTNKTHPVICHVGAANGDSPEKSGRFFALAQRAGFDARHLNLFALEEGDPDTFFRGVDAIYLDGGSTRNLRAILKEWSADVALKDAYEQQVVIAGASAGANILFEWGMTDSIKTKIEATPGLGLVRGSLSVHADIRSDRNEALNRHLAGPDAAFPAYSLDEGTALHFCDNELYRAVSICSEAKVLRGFGDMRMESYPTATLPGDIAHDTI